MKKDLIEKEYVIQAFDKDNNVWKDYERYDTRYVKKVSALKLTKRLNEEQDGEYRLIVCKSFLVQDDVKKEAVQETPKTKSEWISVKECGYPDSDDWVLVSYVECGNTYRFPPNISRWDGERWLTRDNEDDLEYDYCADVTHWMPIKNWKTLI